MEATNSWKLSDIVSAQPLNATGKKPIYFSKTLSPLDYCVIGTARFPNLKSNMAVYTFFQAYLLMRNKSMVPMVVDLVVHMSSS